jgi:hypothetical protein
VLLEAGRPARSSPPAPGPAPRPAARRYQDRGLPFCYVGYFDGMDEGVLRANVTEAKINDVSVRCGGQGGAPGGPGGPGGQCLWRLALPAAAAAAAALAAPARPSPARAASRPRASKLQATGPATCTIHPPTHPPTHSPTRPPVARRYEKPRPGADGDEEDAVLTYGQGTVVPAERIIEAANFKVGGGRPAGRWAGSQAATTRAGQQPVLLGRRATPGPRALPSSGLVGCAGC